MTSTPTVWTAQERFSRTTTVTADIHASAATVWSHLTDAVSYPEWNSTVIDIRGDIRLGERLQLISALDPSRVFHLRVREYVPERRLVWGDRLGSREFTLTPSADDTVTGFRMQERIGGPLFPLFATQIPPFDDAFRRFANDLEFSCRLHPHF